MVGLTGSVGSTVDPEAHLKDTDDCAAWTPTEEPNISAVFFVLLLMSFVTVLMNALVLLAFSAEKRLRTYSNQYIISITVSDLSVGLLMSVRSTMHLFSGWAFGDIPGIIFLGFQNTILSVSVLGVIVVCIDRFIATHYPVKHYQLKSKTKAHLVNATTWLLSIAFWIPATIGWNIVNPATELTSQGFPRPNYTNYASTTFIVAFIRLIGPFFLISVLYVMIYYRVRSTGNERIQKTFNSSPRHVATAREDGGHLPASNSVSLCLSSVGTQDETEGVTTGSKFELDNTIKTDRESSGLQFPHFDLQVERHDILRPGEEDQSAMSDHGDPSRLQSDIIPAVSLSVISTSNTTSTSVPTLTSHRGRGRPEASRGRKAMRTLTFIVVAFFVSWLPNCLNLITYQIDPDLLCRYLEVSIATRWCTYCNSLFNPVAYTLAQPLFRQTFRRVVCRRE